MHATCKIKTSELKDYLLNVAVVRPVFIWGPPGIGKSAIVEEFAKNLSLECVSLVGSQLAPEDLMGVPKIEGDISKFCPPSMIAKKEAYCLFLDEMNACSHDVQKAFYSLILDRRIGDYVMPKGSIIIGAGNRQEDAAIVKPMSTALINRLVHLHLEADYRSWYEWACANNLHTLVLDYLKSRPDHLWSAPSKDEQPFSTPRSWHYLSDVLKSYKETISENVLAVLAYGTLTKEHASSFLAYYKQILHKYALTDIIKGKAAWPREESMRDVLYYLANSFRVYLLKELPERNESLSGKHKELAHNAKALIKSLAEISGEMAKIVVAEDEKNGSLPNWFMVEIARDLPRIMLK